jgi:hypothetical protein
MLPPWDTFGSCSRGKHLSSGGNIPPSSYTSRPASLLVILSCSFKRKCSTTMSAMILKEVISQSTHHVFCIFLDASKDFEHIIWTTSSVVIERCFNYWYNFSVRNSVKQTVIISPILFCFYFDDVLRILQRAGWGCYMGYFFVGALV